MEKVANKPFSGAESNSSQQSYSAHADEFSPSRFQTGLLKDNLNVHADGTLPPWIVKGSQLPATEQFVQWFNSIWHTSDPNNYDEDVFAKNTVLIEPMGISRGAEHASENFWLLFRHFPNLCGEVVSWAANERSIFINWRLMVPSTHRNQPSSVPVTDQFYFMKGRVSFRLATFDTLAMASCLSQSYGMGQLVRFIIKHLRHSKQTGGRSFLPSLLWNLITGIFHRPKVIKTDLKAIPGEVVLETHRGSRGVHYSPRNCL